MVQGLNPGWGEIFRTCPDRPWGPPSLLYSGYWVSFPGVKQPGRGIGPPSSAKVKERVELYLPHWVFVACSGVNFTFTQTLYWNVFAGMFPRMPAVLMPLFKFPR